MTPITAASRPARRMVAAGVASVVVLVVSTVAWLSPPAVSASAVRVDAGSWKTSTTAPDGTTYARTSGFAGGRAGTPAKAPVTGRLGDEILRTGWVGMTAWSAPVPDGTYLVTLAMAETYWKSAGKRVFSATAEGQPFFDDLDLYAAAGPLAELDRQIVVTVDDGSIDLGFRASVDLPAVAAIAVEPATDPTPTPTPTATDEPTATASPTATDEPTSEAPTPEPTSVSSTTVPSTSGDAVLVAAGDLACDPASGSFNGGQGTRTECRQMAVSDLVVADREMTAFAALGDLQYADGTSSAFRTSYDPSYGRVLDRTIPVVGNHEYQTRDASGYFGYFGSRAGDPAKGYYSTDVGPWHVVVLNSNCGEVGCGSGSAQEQWLRADLADSPAMCTVALMHHPRYSSGEHGDNRAVSDLWDTLQQGGADLVLAGHDHDYERFAPMDSAGRLDPQGMRQFVVGTGGKGNRGFGSIRTNSEAHDSSSFGVLRLKLGANSYSWQFVATAGGTNDDSGSASCR